MNCRGRKKLVLSEVLLCAEPLASYYIPHTNLFVQVWNFADLSFLKFANGELGHREFGELIQGHSAGKSWSPRDPGHLIPSLTSLSWDAALGESTVGGPDCGLGFKQTRAKLELRS